jgi:hypothetical protein
MPETDKREVHMRERVEACLRAAAAFEPEERAPVGLAARALAGRPVCRANRGSGLALAMALVGAIVALVAARTLIHSTSRPTKAVTVFVTKPDSKGTVRRPEPRIVRHRALESVSQPHARTAWEATPQEEPTRKEHARLRRWRRYQRLASAPPKVRWHDETVAEYRSGVIEPVWIVQQDSEHDAIVATPALVAVPIQSGEFPPEAGAPDQAQFRRVDYSEEIQDSP